MPFISLIMPVYNNEKYFPIAVESILNQTFFDWELVIVDDGSTDQTPLIADSFAISDKRIKVIHQKNQWIFNSINNGIQKSTGDYVLVVNSDDTINPEALEKIYKVSNDADMILFNLSFCYFDLNENNIVKKAINKDFWISNDFFYSDVMVIHNKWHEFLKKKLICHQCVYKSKIAKDNKYRNDIFGSDYYYNIQIADQIYSIAGTSYPVYNWIDYPYINMNASSGQYYGYEHEMFNDFFVSYKKLFLKWNVWNKESKSVIINQRLTNYTFELHSYLSSKCKLSIEEKLSIIFDKINGGFIHACISTHDELEEYESRILSGLREIFINETPSANSEYYFIYELLNSMLKYEKDEEDILKIKNAVYNSKNLYNVGEIFYKKLRENI